MSNFLTWSCVSLPRSTITSGWKFKLFNLAPQGLQLSITISYANCRPMLFVLRVVAWCDDSLRLHALWIMDFILYDHDNCTLSVTDHIMWTVINEFADDKCTKPDLMMQRRYTVILSDTLTPLIGGGISNFHNVTVTLSREFIALSTRKRYFIS